jgi:hypothetical protein
MSKSKLFLVFLTALATALLVYVPHLNYPLPLHIDEWHHIAEGLRMGNYGEYFTFLKMESAFRFTGMEMGFQFLLFLLSNIFNLVSIYHFLPALWAGVSGVTIFYVVYKKTEQNFLLALLAMIFFATIKSNVNLTGLWFFTPLTFSIPFIFLYTYFLTEGFYQKRTDFLLASLAIMIFLVPVHSLAILFAVPALIVYSLLNWPFIIKKIKIFVLFLIIPLAGILFYKYTLDVSWTNVPWHLLNQLQFKYGWGVLETQNSWTEVYSLSGYLLALLGAGCLIFYGKLQQFSFYLLWPLLVLINIFFYRFTGTSYFAPYQRNLYYLALSLPLLSALGLYFIIDQLNYYLRKFLSQENKMVPGNNLATITINFHLKSWQQAGVRFGLVGLTTIVIIFISLNSYYKVPKDFELYHAIDQEDQQTLTFLATQAPGKVMATPFMSAATYPLSKHNPIASLAFYGDVREIEKFFLKTTCLQKNEMIKQYDIRYIISPAPLECPYQILSAKYGNVIYQVNGKN